MSVFTPVPAAALECWLKDYAVGRLVELQGIAAGVQNSNFFVTTTLGRYVLTLFEDIPRAELPYYLHLMAHLARHGLPVPGPIANRHNEYLGTLEDRPAILVARLAGSSVMTPGPAHCARIGAMLAGLHLAGMSYGRRQENARGRSWRQQTALQLRPQLSAAEQTLLDDSLAAEQQLDWQTLPAGAIHADLFRDNVLWEEAGAEQARIGGVIDFYFAAYDALLFDVAVTVNDWCSQADGRLDPQRSQALLSAYHAERPFSAGEHQAWPVMLRAAALRFWLSRALDFHQRREGELVLVKDPEEYRRMLALRTEQPACLAAELGTVA